MAKAFVRIQQAMRRSQDLLRAIADWPIVDQLVPELIVSDDRLSWTGRALSVRTSDRRLGHAPRRGPSSSAIGPRQRGVLTSSATRWRHPGGAHEEIEPIARAFQPFGVDRGEAFLQPGGALRGQHPLGLLAALNNFDKHREWTVMPVGIDQIALGSEDSPFIIEFDDLTGVEDPVIEVLDLRSDNLADGGVIMAARCRATIKRIEAVGAMRAAVGVPTPAGPIQPDQLLFGLTFVCGLIMLRMEDPGVDTDVIYHRLGLALGEAPTSAESRHR